MDNQELAQALYGPSNKQELPSTSTPAPEVKPSAGAAEQPREPKSFDEMAKSIYGANGKPDKAEAVEAAPENQRQQPTVTAGEYTLKLPEGREIVDHALMGEFSTVAKEFKLGNDQAQKLADLHMKGIDAALKATIASVEKEQAAWRAELRNDTVFGGTQFDATVRDAKWVLDQMGNADEVKRLKQELNMSGLGDHPVMIKGLAKIARQLRQAGVPSPRKMTVAERMFGSNWHRG